MTVASPEQYRADEKESKVKHLVVIGLFIIGVSGVLLSMFAQWNAIDKYQAFYGTNYEALDAAILHHGNTVALPVLLLSLACFVIVAVLLKVNKRRNV